MSETTRSLEELLADPQTHEPVRRASADELDAINRALRDGRARRHDGGQLPARIDGAYLSGEGRWVYPDVDGMPSLLIEERIELDR